MSLCLLYYPLSKGKFKTKSVSTPYLSQRFMCVISNNEDEAVSYSFLWEAEAVALEGV